MTYSPLVLNINRKTSHYKEIYNKNHKRFCQRFVDTVILNQHQLIINLCLKYNIDGTMFNYASVDTDILLWKIRDILDHFMEWKTVREIIQSNEIKQALEKVFIELDHINREWLKVFKS